MMTINELEEMVSITELENQTKRQFLSYFDGLLLGDGCISKHHTNLNYRFAQSCKHKEWLDMIYDVFMNNKFMLYLNERKSSFNSGGFSKNSTFALHSKPERFFTEQHSRWYIKDYNIENYAKKVCHLDNDNCLFAWHKTIPDDISLTPECIVNWYLGDGSIYKIHKKKYNNLYQMQFAMYSYSNSETYFVLDLLNKVVDNCAYNVEREGWGNVIFLNKRYAIKLFFSYIANIKYPYCYSYKFPEVL